MRWYDEIEPGEAVELGRHHFTAEEIVAFAAAFDPQPFHLSEEAAAQSLFGHLAASGWHTASIFMKLLVGRLDADAAERRARGEAVPQWGPSPGFDDMRWSKPVLAGDTIRYVSRILDKRPTASRPAWGIATFHHEAFRDDGEKVFEFTNPIFIPRRDTDQSLARST